MDAAWLIEKGKVNDALTTFKGHIEKITLCGGSYRTYEEWKEAYDMVVFGIQCIQDWRKPQGKALLTQWRTSPVAIDWNNDGLITYAEAMDAKGNDICDRHEIGDPNPDFNLGINLGLTWKVDLLQLKK